MRWETSITYTSQNKHTLATQPFLDSALPTSSPSCLSVTLSPFSSLLRGRTGRRGRLGPRKGRRRSTCSPSTSTAGEQAGCWQIKIHGKGLIKSEANSLSVTVLKSSHHAYRYTTSNLHTLANTKWLAPPTHLHRLLFCPLPGCLVGLGVAYEGGHGAGAVDAAPQCGGRLERGGRDGRHSQLCKIDHNTYISTNFTLLCG